jgi:hypothetical protein
MIHIFVLVQIEGCSMSILYSIKTLPSVSTPKAPAVSYVVDLLGF